MHLNSRDALSEPKLRALFSSTSDDVQADNSALKVRVESQETELKEEGQRMQTLLQQNVQLELDRDRK